MYCNIQSIAPFLFWLLFAHFFLSLFFPTTLFPALTFLCRQFVYHTPCFSIINAIINMYQQNICRGQPLISVRAFGGYYIHTSYISRALHSLKYLCGTIHTNTHTRCSQLLMHALSKLFSHIWYVEKTTATATKINETSAKPWNDFRCKCALP